MRVLVEPNVGDECHDATEEKYSDNAEKYRDKGADGTALLSTFPCVVGVFDLSSMKTAVDGRDVIGWVVAKEIGHWNLPSTSEIGRNSNTCPGQRILSERWLAFNRNYAQNLPRLSA
jgi:hypothetical protein